MSPDKWKRIKKIFYEVIDLPEGERESFVDRQCAEDETMLAEVRSLLASHSDAGSLFELPALTAVSTLVDTAERSRVGEVIGAYRIEREIGRGGMGAVYLASRADDEFDKKVAIKLIKRGFDTDEIVRRFRYERQILAGLEHPNITRLLDGGSTEDGLPYLVMDHVDGERIDRFADRRKLPMRSRLELFLEVCSAVAYAHRGLVVHRDLKPSNILVTVDGRPMLLDFGIAKLTGSDGREQTVEKTIEAFRALTPEYASPEQVAGFRVTTSSDIYSLGVILYELLTGHRPYTFSARTPDEITRVLTDASPTKPSSVCRLRGIKVETDHPQAVVRTLRGDLDNIVLMAMRKEPDRRYSSIEQFAADIRRYLDGLPVIARDDTFGYRASKFIRRNKAGVAAAGGIAASLIGGLIAVSRQAKITARQRDRARTEARKAEKINRFLQKMLASADPRAAGRDSRVTDILRIAANSIESEFAPEPDIAADLHTTIGLTYLGLGDLTASDEHLRAALTIRREVFPGESPEVAGSIHDYGKLLQAKGDLKGAEALFDRALRIAHRLPAVTQIERANILDNLGYVKALSGDTKGAIEMHEEELAIRRKAYGDAHPEVAGAMMKIANVYSVIGRQELSEPLHRKTLEILRHAYGREHPDIALTMINLVKSVLATRPVEAEQLSRDALAMRRRLLGDDHPDVAWALYNLAFVLLTRGNLKEAEDHARSALSHRGPNLPDEHPVVPSALIVLGRTLLARDNVVEALEAFRTCLHLRRKTLPPDHWLAATTQSFIGVCLVRLGNADEGRSLLAESYRILVEKLGTEHDQTHEALERLRRYGSGSASA